MTSAQTFPNLSSLSQFNKTRLCDVLISAYIPGDIWFDSFTWLNVITLMKEYTYNLFILVYVAISKHT